MASFETAFDFSMTSEDPALLHASVADPVPLHLGDTPEVINAKRSARAISGINSFFFPTDFAAIDAIPQASRGPSIERFYEIHFWNAWFNQLTSDRLAMHVYDASVNEGQGIAVKMLQEACNNVSGLSMAVDGKFGPQTLQAANNCNPDMLCEAFRVIRVARYQASSAPQSLKNAWIARANK